MPPIYQLLTPAVVLASVGYIASRFSWREYPALATWLLYTAFLTGMTFGNRPFPLWIMGAQAILLPFVVHESIDRSQIRISLCVLRRWVVAGVLGPLALAATWPALNLMQRVNLWRSYFLIALATAMVTLVVYRLWHPVWEHRGDRAHRYGVMACVLLLAFSGVFVKGGIGYMVFPYTMRTYLRVTAISYWAFSALIAGTAVAMTWVLPARKRAAKAAQATTYTNLRVLGRAA